MRGCQISVVMSDILLKNNILFMIEWRTIEGFDGLYSISSEGEVKVDRRKVGNCYRKERILKPQKDKDGYQKVKLYDTNGHFKTMYIHRLVATYFIPNVSNLPEIDHINSIRTDNRLCNLRWCTHQENIRYRDKKSTKDLCISNLFTNFAGDSNSLNVTGIDSSIANTNAVRIPIFPQKDI